VKDAHCIRLNKKAFIKRLLRDSAKIIWGKEMHILNSLLKIFPNNLFWNSLDIDFKLNSLCWLMSDDGRKFLNSEYKKFIVDIPAQESFQLSDSPLPEDIKIYNNNVETKPKSLKEFMNLW
jgi:hypothetical protein